MDYTPSPRRYESIQYSPCGHSGLLMPQISLGLWHNFGGVDHYENARSMIRKAFDLGITYFDLANNYGPPAGSAEESFGRILSTDLSGYRDEILVSSKAGFYMWPGPYGEMGSKKHLVASLNQSLKRTGLDYFDIFYSHTPDPHTPLEETMQALHSIIKSGKALYAGLSNYPLSTANQAIKILNDLGTPCIVHQPRFNLLDQENKTVINGLHKTGIGCAVYSPLAQGLLTDKYLNGIPQGSRAAKENSFLKPDDVEAHLEQIKILNTVALNRNQKLSQLAISWLLHHEGITSVIVGASKTAQIEDAVESAKRADFTEQEIAIINKALSKD